MIIWQVEKMTSGRIIMTDSGRALLLLCTLSSQKSYDTRLRLVLGCRRLSQHCQIAQLASMDQ